MSEPAGRVVASAFPAWSVSTAEVRVAPAPGAWPPCLDRNVAWGGSTGRGIRVCLIDSGVDSTHPEVGRIELAMTVKEEDESLTVMPDDLGDVAGHGTACAGIIRAIAPDCKLSSVRVLGNELKGRSAAFLVGLEWAVAQNFDVINLSLSTRAPDVTLRLHELADAAYFRRCMLIASAHNMAVESYPWRFASVISVGTHDQSDPLVFHYNSDPPVEFFAKGLDVRAPWLGGRTITATGNSFATAHMAGICALIRAKHPNLTPYEVKTLLRLTATNVDRPQ